MANGVSAERLLFLKFGRESDVERAGESRSTQFRRGFKRASRSERERFVRLQRRFRARREKSAEAAIRSGQEERLVSQEAQQLSTPVRAAQTKPRGRDIIRGVLEREALAQSPEQQQLISDIQKPTPTRGEFERGKAEEFLQRELEQESQRLSQKTEGELTQLAQRPEETGVVGQSTAEGSRFLISPTSETVTRAREFGAREFKDLPEARKRRIQAEESRVVGLQGLGQGLDVFSEFAAGQSLRQDVPSFSEQLPFIGSRIEAARQRPTKEPQAIIGRTAVSSVVSLGAFPVARVRPGFFVPSPKALELEVLGVQKGQRIVFAGGAQEAGIGIRGTGRVTPLGEQAFEVTGRQVTRTPFAEISPGGKLKFGVKDIAQDIDKTVQVGGQAGIVTKERFLVDPRTGRGLGPTRTEVPLGRGFRGGGEAGAITLDTGRISEGIVGRSRLALGRPARKGEGVIGETTAFEPLARFRTVRLTEKTTDRGFTSLGRGRGRQSPFNIQEASFQQPGAGAVFTRPSLPRTTTTSPGIRLEGPGAFSVLRQQPSAFAGTGQFERTGLVAPLTPQRLAPSTALQTPDNIQRIVPLTLDIQRTGLRERSLVGARPAASVRLTPSLRQGQLTGQVQTQGERFGDLGFRGRGFDFTGFDIPTGPRGGFGFALPPFPVGQPERRKRKAKGGRQRFRRAPSLGAVLLDIRAPSPSIGEFTGLVERPILT